MLRYNLKYQPSSRDRNEGHFFSLAKTHMAVTLSNAGKKMACGIQTRSKTPEVQSRSDNPKSTLDRTANRASHFTHTCCNTTFLCYMSYQDSQSQMRSKPLSRQCVRSRFPKARLVAWTGREYHTDILNAPCHRSRSEGHQPAPLLYSNWEASLRLLSLTRNVKSNRPKAPDDLPVVLGQGSLSLQCLTRNFKSNRPTAPDDFPVVLGHASPGT